MEKLKRYQTIVQDLLTAYAQTKPAYGDYEANTIFDTARGHYLLLHMGWHHKRWVHHPVIHLDIRENKIWIFRNDTEHDLGQILVEKGVPKQDIVIGFHPPHIRQYTDYAAG